MRSDLIELTETWAARITVCGNAETLGINDETAWGMTESEATSAVVSAGQRVVTDWSPDCSEADLDSFFPHWNGGKHYSATFRAYGVAAELYHREPEAQAEDDLVYTDWSWASKKETPAILRDGMTAIVEQISDAMSKAREEMEANAAVENAKFAAENPVASNRTWIAHPPLTAG